MTLELTAEKRTNIGKTLEQFDKRSYKIEEFASLIGKLTAACTAIPYGWLYTKSFEKYKMIALKNNNDRYDSPITMSRESLSDLAWWKHRIETAVRPLTNQKFCMTI